MSEPVRRYGFLVVGPLFGLFLLWGMSGLPPFGSYRGPYGDILNSIAVRERHVTDIVAAVNFDYRGIDTIGEEFILFTAVTAVVLLLRTERDESEEEAPPDESVDRNAEPSDALHALCLLLVPITTLLGLYIVTHGHLTPGGGFQGGTILASAIILLFLGGEYSTLKVFSHEERSEIWDAVGAGGFVLIGLGGLAVGVAYLQDFLPLGPVGKLDSAGTIPLINLSVGLEVAGGFLLILNEFLRQTLQVRAESQGNAKKGAKSGDDEGRRTAGGTDASGLDASTTDDTGDGPMEAEEE